LDAGQPHRHERIMRKDRKEEFPTETLLWTWMWPQAAVGREPSKLWNTVIIILEIRLIYSCYLKKIMETPFKPMET
jgi:hypothetical protein